MSNFADQTWTVGLELGAELRAARRRANKTMADVSAARLGSRDKMHRLESGRGPYKWQDVQALCGVYDVAPAQAALMIEMARVAAEHGHTWTEGGPRRFGLYLRMERRATRLRVVTLDLVHGLVQSEAHHRAMLDAWPMESPAAETEAVRARVERQAQFWARQDVSLELVMSEVALRHRIGSDEIMQAQVDRLRQLADRDGVQIRVIPIDSPPHGGMTGEFTMIETPQGMCAYTEHLDGGRLMSDPQVVQVFEQAADSASAAAIDIREWR